MTEDVDEAPFVYGFLADLVEANSPHVLGINNSNLPRWAFNIHVLHFEHCFPSVFVMYLDPNSVFQIRIRIQKAVEHGINNGSKSCAVVPVFQKRNWSPLFSSVLAPDRCDLFIVVLYRFLWGLFCLEKNSYDLFSNGCCFRRQNWTSNWFYIFRASVGELFFKISSSLYKNLFNDWPDHI